MAANLNKPLMDITRGIVSTHAVDLGGDPGVGDIVAFSHIGGASSYPVANSGITDANLHGTLTISGPGAETRPVNINVMWVIAF